ncbi:MAG TPA: hypothetical protein VJ276_25680 [Thermoanaerobaculia bacterium]|nr:hypothetical protein [Thermoanaerobaculia bacterium]
MMFVVEKMDLTDGRGSLEWSRTPAPRRHCEILGADAQRALAAVVAGEGGVQLGVAATYTDGQAIMVARKGQLLYALRAVPREPVRS